MLETTLQRDQTCVSCNHLYSILIHITLLYTYLYALPMYNITENIANYYANRTIIIYALCLKTINSVECKTEIVCDIYNYYHPCI